MKHRLFVALCLLLGFGAISSTSAQGIIPIPCEDCPIERIRISGTIKTLCNQPISGVQVTITDGFFVRTVFTNASGVYNSGFLGLGTYTVTPSKARYTFEPPSATVFGEVGGLYVANFTAYLNHAPSDFNGDGITDVAVFRPSNGTWYVEQPGGFSAYQFGLAGDLAVPEDYDGDGATDYAVFRPSNNTWYITNSSDGAVVIVTFGNSGDIPVPGNYDCDGKADIAVFNPTTGDWSILHSPDNSIQNVHFGTTGDKPVQADFDGDGKVNLAVFRPSEGNWYIQNPDTSYYAKNFGLSGDVPVPSDYTGDRVADVAVFRPSDNTWYVSTGSSYYGQPWGQSRDKLTPGNYDGDLKTDVSIMRPTHSQSVWHTLLSASGTVQYNYFGLGDDVPVASAYIPELR